jgi:hypothetical protein
LVAAKHRDVWNDDIKCGNYYGSSREDAQKLGQELLAHIGAKKVAALQIGQ